jgi:hypothetical protein
MTPQTHIWRKKIYVLGTLNKVLETKSNKNEIFLMGDFNARIRKEEHDQVVCHFGKQERDKNSERLREICNYHNLKISNTFYDHDTRNLRGYRKPEN